MKYIKYISTYSDDSKEILVKVCTHYDVFQGDVEIHEHEIESIRLDNEPYYGKDESIHSIIDDELEQISDQEIMKDFQEQVFSNWQMEK